MQEFWRRCHHLLKRAAYYPDWLSHRRHMPYHPYGIASVIALMATLVEIPIIVVDPDFPFAALVVLSATVVVALHFGPGPGLLTNCLEAVLLALIFIPLHARPGLQTVTMILSIGLFVGLGGCISFLIGRSHQQNRQIIQMQRDAQAQMDAFLGVAAHEMRTPLTVLSANAQLQTRMLQKVRQALAQENTQGAQVEMASLDAITQRTESQIKRLNALITEVIELSRIKAGKLDLHMAVCEINAIVRMAVEEQRLITPDRSICLFETQPTLIVGDANRLGQVVTNLLTNALKYSPADTPVKIIVARSGDDVRATITDAGSGIPPEHQSRLWKPFYRVPGAAVQSGSGINLGLGLFICKIIIDEHHGAIGVNSVPGQGASFWFTLPILHAERREPSQEVSESHSHSF